MSLNKKICIPTLILILIFLGFVRDFVFVQTNIIMYNKWSNSDYPFHPFMNWINQFDYWFLYRSKWFLTLFFITLYLGISYLLTKMIFNHRQITKILILLFSILIFLSGLSFLLGWIFNNLEEGYAFSRMFVGIIQSPVPVMLIIPFGLYYKQTEK